MVVITSLHWKWTDHDTTGWLYTWLGGHTHGRIPSSDTDKDLLVPRPTLTQTTSQIGKVIFGTLGQITIGSLLRRTILTCMTNDSGKRLAAWDNTSNSVRIGKYRTPPTWQFYKRKMSGSFLNDAMCRTERRNLKFQLSYEECSLRETSSYEIPIISSFRVCTLVYNVHKKRMHIWLLAECFPHHVSYFCWSDLHSVWKEKQD